MCIGSAEPYQFNLLYLCSSTICSRSAKQVRDSLTTRLNRVSSRVINRQLQPPTVNYSPVGEPLFDGSLFIFIHTWASMFLLGGKCSSVHCSREKQFVVRQ